MTASAWPPEAEIVDHSRAVEVRVLLLELVERPHGGIEATIRFKRVPIGLIDGLAEHEDFFLGGADFTGEPGVEDAFSAVQKMLLPGNGNDLDAAAGLPEIVRLRWAAPQEWSSVWVPMPGSIPSCSKQATFSCTGS